MPYFSVVFQGQHQTGQVSGRGVFDFLTHGIAVYPTAAAAAARPQTISAAQEQIVLSTALQGPGIGQGFGLGPNVQQLPGAIAGDLFHGLSLSSALLRIGEVVLGIVLVAIGLNAVLKNPAAKAARVAAVVK